MIGTPTLLARRVKDLSEDDLAFLLQLLRHNPHLYLVASADRYFLYSDSPTITIPHKLGDPDHIMRLLGFEHYKRVQQTSTQTTYQVVHPRKHRMIKAAQAAAATNTNIPKKLAELKKPAPLEPNKTYTLITPDGTARKRGKSIQKAVMLEEGDVLIHTKTKKIVVYNNNHKNAVAIDYIVLRPLTQTDELLERLRALPKLTAKAVKELIKGGVEP